MAEENNKKFGELLGTTGSTVHAWVNEDSYPSGKHLLTLTEKYCVSMDWLFTGKGDRYLPKPGQVAEPREVYSRRLDHLSHQEREYTEKLLEIFRKKEPGVVSAITQNIDTFLLVPDAQKKSAG